MGNLVKSPNPHPQGRGVTIWLGNRSRVRFCVPHQYPGPGHSPGPFLCANSNVARDSGCLPCCPEVAGRDARAQRSKSAISISPRCSGPVRRGGGQLKPLKPARGERRRHGRAPPCAAGRPCGHSRGSWGSLGGAAHAASGRAELGGHPPLGTELAGQEAGHVQVRVEFRPMKAGKLICTSVLSFTTTREVCRS
mgnify:CR=1 FL=1